MLRFTRRSEYGILALAYLAGNDSGYVSAKTIVEGLCLPRRLLAEVLKELAQAGLIDGLRGPNGGYRLRVRPEDIHLAAIVGALEGQEPKLVACTNGQSCELEAHCLVQDGMRQVHGRILDVLRGTTLASFLHAKDAAARPIEV
ncbi:MAG TPA: Rrf2 family transcriptional regulator [Planctomycetota bacterium]